MDFSITAEQKQFSQEVVEFGKSIAAKESDKETFHQEIWEQIADFGLLGLTVSEKYGGLEESYLTAAIMLESLGYAYDNNGMIFAVNNHIWVAQNLIYLYGSETLKEKYLYEMVKGKRIGAIAITESDAGSDAMSMKTEAVLDGDCYVLNGNKMFISNGPIADLFVVFACTSTEENSRKYTAFVIDKDFDGVMKGADIKKMGLGACPTSEISFKNCRIPKENILGSLDKGGNILMAALEWERFYEFVPHIGRMKHIMERCFEHANNRRQFKKKIGENQAISHKIAEMKVSIELAETMMYKIAWLKDQKKSAFTETCIFKLFVSEQYIKMSEEAIAIFGAYGYSTEYSIEREHRDAIASRIHSGTNEIQKNNIYNMLSFDHY